MNIQNINNQKYLAAACDGSVRSVM